MNKILLPDNISPYDHKEIVRFIECAGYEILVDDDFGDAEEMFYTLSEQLFQQYFDKGMRLFLITNTYDKFPGRKFITGWTVEYVIGEPVKEYVVKEYRHF